MVADASVQNSSLLRRLGSHSLLRGKQPASPLAPSVVHSNGEGATAADAPTFLNNSGRGTSSASTPLLASDNGAPNLYLCHPDHFNRNELARRVQEARQFAELKAHGELVRQKQVFMEKVFHEIRTPCHTLQMITKTLLDTVPEGASADLRAQLEVAWAQGVYISQLADDVQLVMQLQGGELPAPRLSWFPLAPLISDVSCLVEKLFPRKAVEVQCKPALPPEFHIYADIAALCNVLRHLLTNAVRFSTGGPVVLNVSSTLTAGEQPLTFTVTNAGPPISEAVIRHMGQRYLPELAHPPGPSALQDSCSGFGIGLYVSFHHIRRMGGRLEVENLPSDTQVRFTVVTPTHLGAEGAECPQSRSQASLAPSFRCSPSQSPLLPHGLPFERPPSAATSQPLDVPESTSVSGLVSLTSLCAPTQSPFASFRSLLSLDMTPSQTPRHASAPPLPPGRQPPPSPSNRTPSDPPPAETTHRWRCLLPWPRRKRKYRISAQPNASTPPSGPSEVPPRSPATHVLVVEDNLVCQRVVCHCLEVAGITHTVAPNGQAACDLVAAQPSAFDVILMDLRMPVMDGIAATYQIRHQLHAPIPIVIFSAEVGQATLERASQAGATDWLAKPATPQMVVATIRKHCP